MSLELNCVKKYFTFFFTDLFFKRANTFLTFILDGSLSFRFLFTTFAVLEIDLSDDLTEVCSVATLTLHFHS